MAVRNPLDNLEIAQQILDAVAEQMSGITLPPETHIALAEAYTHLAEVSKGHYHGE